MLSFNLFVVVVVVVVGVLFAGANIGGTADQAPRSKLRDPLSTIATRLLINLSNP